MGEYEYIEREGLHKSMSINITDDPGCPSFVAATVHQTIDCEPAADVRPERYGKWLDIDSVSYCCDQCGCKSNRESRFCPDCGAKMTGKEEEK